MQLINEQNNLAIAVLDILENRLQTLLKLTAVFCTRDQRTHVQRENLLILQIVRHIALHDALRETLDDRRLADAGLADQYRIVFCLSRQNPYDIADLLVSADDRIKLVVLCLLHQLLAVF